MGHLIRAWQIASQPNKDSKEKGYLINSSSAPALEFKPLSCVKSHLLPTVYFYWYPKSLTEASNGTFTLWPNLWSLANVSTISYIQNHRIHLNLALNLDTAELITLFMLLMSGLKVATNHPLSWSWSTGVTMTKALFKMLFGKFLRPCPIYVQWATAKKKGVNCCHALWRSVKKSTSLWYDR